jgi:hypothetical protein
MLVLREMDTDDRRQYLDSLPALFASEGVRANAWDASAAAALAAATFNVLLPNGELTPGHVFLGVQRSLDHQRVGAVWLMVRRSAGLMRATILDFQLVDQFRRVGLGVKVLRLVEAECARRGAATIEFTIFAHNADAHRVAEYSGYVTSQIAYRKSL